MNWTTLKEHRWTKRIIEVFSQGLSPKDLALSISLGALIGVLPVFGVSTLIVTALVLWFRLNLPVALFMTYAVGPIHLLMFIPFIRIGEYIMNAEHTLLTFISIKEAFVADYLDALSRLFQEVICGLAGWTLVAIPVAFILSRILWGLFLLVKKRKTDEVG